MKQFGKLYASVGALTMYFAVDAAIVHINALNVSQPGSVSANGMELNAVKIEASLVCTERDDPAEVESLRTSLNGLRALNQEMEQAW